MSESQLNKDFTERDLARARNIISGNTADRTRIQVGFEKSSKEYKEGDVWEVKGKTWTIKNGIRQTISKLDSARKAIRVPMECPKCGDGHGDATAQSYLVNGFRINNL